MQKELPTITAEQIAKTHNAQKVVIVASRRTDIPAFHIQELIDGLQKGIFHPQPMMNRVRKFVFAPYEIHSIGLWSQNFTNWIEQRRKIHGLDYKFWYRFTILPDNKICKPKAPPVDEQLKQLETLTKTDGAGSTFLFVDPLIKYRNLGVKKWQYNFSEKSLRQIFEKASSLGIKRIGTSFLDYYKKIERQTKSLGVKFRFLDPAVLTDRNQMIEMLSVLESVAREYEIAVKTCCEKLICSYGASQRGACVDGTLLNKLFGPGASTKHDNGQRTSHGCACTYAIDIGRYTDRGQWSHACGHECPQCYARP
ncbi:MAG: DUF1848 family protein [Pseudomonadota bacterium]